MEPATEVSVVTRTSKVLGPVVTSHWVHGGLDKDGDHFEPIDGIEGTVNYFHGQRLQRSAR